MRSTPARRGSSVGSRGYFGAMARRGWRRLGRKRFRYLDAHDLEITNEEKLERISALVIPPAWTDVWISPNPRARLQATGIDAAGRKQYLYHASYRAAQEREKFERLLGFAKSLPRLRARTDRHLRLDPYEREWTCALAVGLINKAWFRVGSERHARSSRTYGVTTLRKRHARVEGDEIAFRFHAKNRKLVRRTIVNARLAEGVEELLALPNGSRLFRFERDGGLADLTSELLNEYIGDNLGEGYTAKDFRTWGGTLVAAEELERRGLAESDADAKRKLAAVMRHVGQELGNTAAVARASYVSPVVLEHYLAGRTIADFRSQDGSVPRHLTSSEHALIELLERAP
jgi:DNA topoisomerase I